MHLSCGRTDSALSRDPKTPPTRASTHTTTSSACCAIELGLSRDCDWGPSQGEEAYRLPGGSVGDRGREADRNPSFPVYLECGHFTSVL